jgi:virulence factor
MLKVAIIGLGDIAQKAYLPVISTRKDIEFHLCSRNEETLKNISDKYRFLNLHASMDSLINARPDCAFVHATTEAHYTLVKLLLEEGIHVYVDKPITMHYATSKELVDLAEEKNLILMVGFNRRFAPLYASLLEVKNPTMIIMQKNRKGLPDPTRRFVVEDFIHVVDTLRFLFPYTIQEFHVHGITKGEMLHQVTLQLIAPGGETAIGIMNRDTGATVEKLEVMNQQEIRTVNNVTEMYMEQGVKNTRISDNDWQSTLYKRGFDQMIDDFLNAVRVNGKPRYSSRDALVTHELCEKIVEKMQLIN